MITSKPRHDQPIGVVRDGMVYATPQFQRYMDDLERAVSEAQEQIADLITQVEALEP